MKNIKLMNGTPDKFKKYTYVDESQTIFKEKLINEKNHILGIDEVAAGTVAGPLTVAGVILPLDHNITELPIDSKLLNEEQIDILAGKIREKALYVGISFVTPYGVSQKGVENSKRHATQKISEFVRWKKPDLHIKIDGTVKIKDKNGQPIKNQKAIAKADGTIDCVSAAAIIAKSWFNAQMRLIHELYPEFGFDKHKGYVKNEHIRAIQEHGLCEFHRPKLAEKLLKRKSVKEEANLDTNTLKEYLAVTATIANREKHILNDWEHNFIKEQMHFLKKNMLPNPRKQYFIQKTYKKAMEKAKNTNVDVESAVDILFRKTSYLQTKKTSSNDVHAMLKEMFPKMKENPSLLTNNELELIKEILGLLKQGLELSEKQIKMLKKCYKKTQENIILTA